MPGHEETEAFRSEGEARAILAGATGLEHAVLRAFQPFDRSSGQYDGANIAGGMPADGCTRLYVRRMPEPIVMQLRTALDGPHPQLGVPTDQIAVQAIRADEVKISGPHDVLRWLAYDAFAAWA